MVAKRDRTGYARPVKELTYELAFKTIDYDPLTGIFRWKQDRNSTTVRAGAVAGYLSKKGYLVIFIFGRLYMANRLAWLLSYKEWPAKHVDHENCMKNDNRLSNLRAATVSQNGCNKRLTVSNTTGAKGVSPYKGGRYQVKVKVKGKYIWMGVHSTLDEAAHAYNKGAIKHHGEFAVLNPIGVDK